MKNEITKFLAYDKKVSVICIETTEITEYIKNLHDLTPTTTAVLGRIITAATLIAHTDLKSEEDSLTIQLKGDGPCGISVAIVELENLKTVKIKAYIQNPHVELPLNKLGKINVGGAVGNTGFLNIIKQNEDTGANYNGIVPLVTGEIAEDFAEFFAKSQQRPTAIALGVLVDKDGVKKAGGYMINPMPDATEEEITKIEEAISNSPTISQMLEQNMGLEEIAKKVTGDENLEVLEKDLRVEYECKCSKEKIKRGIISLGKEEIQKIIEEDEKLEATCHFCNKKYEFTKKELEGIIKEAK